MLSLFRVAFAPLEVTWSFLLLSSPTGFPFKATFSLDMAFALMKPNNSAYLFLRSTVSSGVNSLAAVTLEDVVKRYIVQDMSDRSSTTLTRLLGAQINIGMHFTASATFAT